MSAICGVIGTDGRRFAACDLAGVLRMLRPLGGAGEGSWSGTVGRTGVAVGVCEDALLSASRPQPLRSAEGNLTIVADALLDCRADLLASLPLGGDASDAELILGAYERWGEQCLERLSGEFAFALADERRGGVLIARDQVGVRPLQVHERPGVVAFATTALSLCALAGVGHDLDRVRVGEWLTLYGETERTFVNGVTTLPPGHCAWINSDGLRRRGYWSLDTRRIVERDSPQAYASELRQALDSAVDRRVPHGERFGVLLSGGLDSTSVAATAARLRPDDPIRTYTSAPPDGWSGHVLADEQDADESDLVRQLAERHPNLRPTFIRGDLGPLLARHDERFLAGSPPARNPCNELWMNAAQAQASADGVRRLLTGARGNAFFSGDDPFWLAALLRHGRLAMLMRELVALGTRRAARELTRQLAPHLMHRLRDARRARAAGLDDEVALRFAGAGTRDVVRSHADYFEQPPWRSLRERNFGVFAFPGYAAEAAAVRDALAGVRNTDPTSDLRVIATAAVQPPWARRRAGRTRAVARDAMADRLPPSIVERTRRGAQLPDWLERMTERRGELEDELAAAREHPTCRELIDLEAIDGALRAWPDVATAREQRRRTTTVYRYNLFRALLMCRYLRLFDTARRARTETAR